MCESSEKDFIPKLNYDDSVRVIFSDTMMRKIEIFRYFRVVAVLN
jgi:hypothetical protein